jgi:CBS domain-containing protein
MIRARSEREPDFDASPTWDEAYFDTATPAQPVLDGAFWKEPLTAIPTRPLLVCDGDTSVRAAMQAMQQGHRGYVVVTEDGTPRTRLIGIFTERDVLLRVIDGGRNPAEIRIGDVMTRDPETLPVDARIAWALNLMSIGGFPRRRSRGAPDGGRRRARHRRAARRVVSCRDPEPAARFRAQEEPRARRRLSAGMPAVNRAIS